MKVYTLSESYWHHVDGSWLTLLDIYQSKEGANAQADLLNKSEGYSNSNCGKEFVVEEKDLKL